MKNEILKFILGILVGAIIATLGWFVYLKSINVMSVDDRQMMQNGFNGERPEMPQDMNNMPLDMPAN